jgi:hypothetical protein
MNSAQRAQALAYFLTLTLQGVFFEPKCFAQFLTSFSNNLSLLSLPLSRSEREKMWFWIGVLCGIYISVAGFIVVLLKPLKATPRTELISLFFSPKLLRTMMQEERTVLFTIGERPTHREIKDTCLPDDVAMKGEEEKLITDREKDTKILQGVDPTIQQAPANEVEEAGSNNDILVNDKPFSNSGVSCEALESDASVVKMVEVAEAEPVGAPPSVTIMPVLEVLPPPTVTPIPPTSRETTSSVHDSLDDEVTSFRLSHDESADEAYQSRTNTPPLIIEGAVDSVEYNSISSAHPTLPVRAPDLPTRHDDLNRPGDDASQKGSPVLTPASLSPEKSIVNAPEIPASPHESRFMELVQQHKKSSAAMKATESFFAKMIFTEKTYGKEIGKMSGMALDIFEDSLHDVWKNLGMVLDSTSALHSNFAISFESLCNNIALASKDHDSIGSYLEVAAFPLFKDLNRLKTSLSKAIVTNKKAAVKVSQLFEEMAAVQASGKSDDKIKEKVGPNTLTWMGGVGSLQ